MGGYGVQVLTIGLEDRSPGQPVLVLQAGAGQSLSTWNNLLDHLPPGTPLVAYDRPGLGASAFDGVDPTPEHVTGHLHALLAALDVSPPYVLVGHSRGVLLQLDFANRYPDDVVGMVYLDPADPLQTVDEVLAAADSAEYLARLAEFEERRARGRAGLSPGQLAERRVVQARSEVPAGRRPEPRLPRVPTAMVFGTRYDDPGLSFTDRDWWDEWTGRRLARFQEWAADLPQTTVTVTSEAGHYVHVERPDLAAAAVAQVLDALER